MTVWPLSCTYRGTVAQRQCGGRPNASGERRGAAAEATEVIGKKMCTFPLHAWEKTLYDTEKREKEARCSYVPG